MKKYFVENGRVVINKYCVEYSYHLSNGNTETNYDVCQYIVNDGELESLISELKQKNIEFNVFEMDIKDIACFNGIPADSYEDARKIIEPTLEEVKADKIKEISSACQKIIFNGIDVALSDGSVKHFSLKTEDQINLNGLVNQVSLGNIKAEAGVPYHADGELCTLFSIADFTLVANTAMSFILRQTTYCNHLMALVRSLETRAEIDEVFYGQELTGEFLNSYNSVIGGDSDE